ncbi:patatin-like phospholipase family protein [Luteibacter aegosomatissinici]|uniref:patatin-like phospholipase family protein n=1 Tax=Luteibacter aegosomatissinici TaxID=2911539 RepID=UPI001FF8DC48|nr:patatin-like phospholipase family protein [Luteibacter aegosomatissinici]UPG95587.1 patatin-like phospholipase family protein [Luteibacter aegosomatissinici]
MRRSRLAVAAFIAFTSVTTVHAASLQPSPCIGLVLGGGGARGAAHIGVIQVLEREHIPICRVAGTSMGSIVGGLYAAGYNADEMARVIGQLDWKDLFSDDPDRAEEPMHRKDADYRYLLNFEVGYKNGHIVTPAGVVQGQKLLLLLRRLLISTWNVHDFNDLSIPFRAVATDIVIGKPVVFASGDLPLAIRSSMSVPGAFAPTNVEGRLLVDGGLMDNVPIDVVRDMGADRLIVVDVGSPLAEESQLSNPVALLNQMVSALMAEKTDRQLKALSSQDILIRPALGKLGAGEFNRAEEAIAIGRAAAEAALPRLRALSASPQAWQAFVESHRQRNFDPKLVAFIDVDDRHTHSGMFAGNQLQPEVGKTFDPKDVEARIGTIYGQGSYQQVDYHLVERDGDRGIRLTPVDKAWGPIYGKMGFQLDDDFNGRSEYLLSAEITATNLNDSGGEWRNTLWSGRIGGIRSEFFQPFGQGSSVYVMPTLTARNEEVPVFDGKGDKQLAEYQIRRRAGELELGWTPRSYWRISASVARGRDSGDLRVGEPSTFPNGTSDYASLGLGLDWDSLDNAQFPTRGSHLNFRYTSFRTFMGGKVDGDVARLVADWIPDWGLSTGRYHLLLGLRASSALDNTNFFESQAFLGGFLNLSGYGERSLYGTQAALGRAVLYRRTGNLDAIFSTPIYIGMSLEAGNTWRDKNDVRLDSLIYAGSIFAGLQSPLGPVFLGVGHAAGGHTAVYLTFGSLLRPGL